MRKEVAIAVLIGLFSVSAFSGVSELLQDPATTAVSALGGAVNPDSVELQAGVKTFTVRLSANKTTGYGWYLQDYSRELIESVSYRYQAPTSGMIGASGLSVWVFHVLAGVHVPTVAHITWRYARPWAATSADRLQKTAVFIPAG